MNQASFAHDYMYRNDVSGDTNLRTPSFCDIHLTAKVEKFSYVKIIRREARSKKKKENIFTRSLF